MRHRRACVHERRRQGHRTAGRLFRCRKRGYFCAADRSKISGCVVETSMLHDTASTMQLQLALLLVEVLLGDDLHGALLPRLREAIVHRAEAARAQNVLLAGLELDGASAGRQLNPVIGQLLDGCRCKEPKRPGKALGGFSSLESTRHEHGSKRIQQNYSCGSLCLQKGRRPAAAAERAQETPSGRPASCPEVAPLASGANDSRNHVRSTRISI